MKSKIVSTEQAISMIKSGDCVMIGGFGGVGVPYKLIEEISKINLSVLHDLHIITNDAGRDGLKGVADIIFPGRVVRLTTTYVNGNSRVSDMIQSHAIDVTLFPIGSLFESIRAAGSGLGGVLTPTGIGTKAAEGKKIFELNGKKYILAEPLYGDVALIGAWKADEEGNLILRRVQKTYNIAMALASTLVIAEVDEIVPSGCLDPDEITIPGVLVKYLVKA